MAYKSVLARTGQFLLSALLAACVASASAANPLVAVLEDFESGGTHSALAVDATNSAATGASNSVAANVTESGSKRLQMTDPDGTYNGLAITLTGAIPAAGYYLITADVKVDNASTTITSFGMGAVVGGTSTAKISDVNAGYVMNLTGNNDAGLGYQTIGAAIQVPADGTFPKDVTLYFSTDPSGNDYNASAYDGNYNGSHRGGLDTWAAGSTSAVYIDNVKRIGPGNFGEERHMWISLGDSYTNLATLENWLVQAKNNNFNCVDILARYRADAYYVPGRTDKTYPNPEPFGVKVGGKPASATNDPLQYAIDRGHELGLKVYASFSCFMATDASTAYPAYLPANSQMWYYNAGAPRVMLPTDPSAEGIWTDPGIAAVRTYTKNVLMDMVSNYDLDGVIFDRIRYPSINYSYNPTSLAEMGISGTPATNDATFRNGRREAIATFLQDSYESVTTVKPWMVVGTVPIAYSTAMVDTYNQVMQFWPKWSARKTANRAISFGCCDLYQPQLYRLVSSGAPASNTTLMNKAQFGDIATYSLDFGLMPGAMAALSPLFYHPTAADTAQSNANAQNITDGRALAMTGFGLYPANKVVTDIALIRAPGASTAGVDVLASPSAPNDYLMKADYDNVKPNAVTNFTATPLPSGMVNLAWSAPAAAADGETAEHYLVYKSTTTPVKEYWANLVTKTKVTGTALTVPTDYAGNYYFKIVPVDDYNNHGTATQIGPFAVVGEPVPPADVIVDNIQATFGGSWLTGTSSADKYATDYRYLTAAGTGTKTATFAATIPTTGKWAAYEWHCQGTNRATNARHAIVSDAGTNVVTMNQVTNGGKWNYMAESQYTAGQSYSITIDDVYSGSVVIADAVKWQYVVEVPPAPTGLAGSPASQTSVNLTWTDNSTTERNYFVSRGTSAEGPFTDLAVLGIDGVSYTDTGLTANTTYYYVVRCENSGGASANSNVVAVTTLPNPPAAPSGLAAAPAGTSQIDLVWSDNSSNETNFVIARSTTSGGPYTDVATVAANTTTYSNTGLSPATTYYYVVRAINTGGASGNSNQASATTQMLPPAAPSGLAASAVSYSQINLSWTDNSGNEANFVVARSTTSGGPYTDIATLAANTTSYSNTGLSGGTTYYYVVRGVNAGGASANSNQASATTPAALPAAPSNLVAAVAGPTQINLTWADNSSNETNFVVSRSSTSGGPYADIATLGANTTSYSSTGLAVGGTYYYVVRATNASGASANSNQASATTTVPDIIVDNPSATFSGTWTTGSSSGDKYGADYKYATSGSGGTATYNANVPVAGTYRVQVWYPIGTNRANNAPYKVNFDGGSLTYSVNQQANGGAWITLGAHYFALGGGQVVIETAGANPSVVMADAVRFAYMNAATPVTLTLDSNATYDGYVLESGETTNVGGTVNTANNTIPVGDDSSKRQFRGFLSFDTAGIPDGATIQKVTLKVTRYSLNGTDPWAALGTLTVDIKKPYWGAAVALATDDFAASGDSYSCATVPKPSGNGVTVSAGLNANGVFSVNKTGTTQLRLRFTTDDNNDALNNYINFYSGNYSTNTAYRPKLEVQYAQ